MYRPLFEEEITVAGEQLGRLARRVGNLGDHVVVDKATTGLENGETV